MADITSESTLEPRRRGRVRRLVAKIGRGLVRFFNRIWPSLVVDAILRLIIWLLFGI